MAAVRRLFLLAFIWGWSFLFIKVAVEGMTPPTVAFGRVGLGAAVLMMAVAASGRRVPSGLTIWWRFAVAALFGNVVPFTLLAWGEQRITSALTAVLNASTPLFTAVAAAIYLGDRLHRRQIAGLLLGFAGVGVAAGLGGGDVAHSSVLGSLASVAAGAFYGVAFVYMRRNLTHIEPIVAAAGQLVMATVLLLPPATVTSIHSGIDLTSRRALALGALGLLGTGVAYMLNYAILAELGATATSLVTYLIPIVAIAVGIVVLSEPFESRMVIGGIVTIAGIALVRARAGLRVPAAVVSLMAPVSSADSDSGGSSGASGIEG